MTARSAARHASTELTYCGCDDAREIVWFTAASRSNPGKVNTVAWDTVTRTAHCDCKAAEIGEHICWHADLVEVAYLEELARQFVARLGDAGLLAAGWHAHQRVTVAIDFWPAATPLDHAILRAARAEFRRRCASGRATSGVFRAAPDRRAPIAGQASVAA